MDENTRFTLALNSAADAMRAAEAKTAEAVARFDHAQRKAAERGYRFSITRAVQCMTAEGGAGLRTGIEAEYAQEQARQAGRTHDMNRPTFGWEVLLGERALVAGTGAAGGYLIGTSAQAWDAISPYSITAQAGLTILPNLVGNVVIGREATSGTAAWVGEAVAGTASEMTLGGVSLSPKNGFGFMQVSGRLLQQASATVDGLVARGLRREIGTLIDAAVIAGTSTDSTVPLGLRYQSGLTVSTGTALSHATMLGEQKSIAAANVIDAKHAFIANPDTRELLAARAVGTSGARYLWDDDRIVGRPAYVSPAVGTKSLYHGDWSQVCLGIWGGFTIEHDPFSGFKSDTHGFRIMVACDVGVLQPAALRGLVGIT